jgi:hypothetical protein
MLVAAAGLLLASNVQASIVFDDFNAGIGTHFNSVPNSSGTTNILHTATGTANQNSTTHNLVSPFEGAGALNINITGGGQAISSPAFPRIRFVSGGGTVANNIAFTPTAGVDGWIGYYYKTPVAGSLPGSLPSGLQLTINLDGGTGGLSADADAGVAKNAIMDGQWHLVEWDLDNPADWGAFAGVGGDGVLQNGVQRTIDSIYFRYPLGGSWPGYTGVQTLNIDFVAKSDSGSIAALVPEPASIGVLLLAGAGLLRRRR